MLYSLTAQATFEADHRALHPLRCQMVHGHHFTITASISHEELDEGMPRGSQALESYLGAVAKEFDGRPLEEMMPDRSHTLPHLAAYVFERLAPTFKGLVLVSVSDGHLTGTVEVA